MSGRSNGAMRHVAAVLAVVWLVGALVIEIGSFLPFDPEWSLLPTAALFGSSFLIAGVGTFAMAPALILIRKWPAPVLRRLRWFGLAWVIYTLIWFIALFTLPGIPTHCGTPCSPACAHEYVFNNHGMLTVTTRDGFVGGVRILVRVFASPSIAGLSVILLAYRLRARTIPSGRIAHSGISGRA